METLQQLVLIYAVVGVLNFALAALLWLRNRTPLYRSLFTIWAAGLVFMGSQVIPSRGELWLALSGLPAFMVSYSLATLIARISGFALHQRLYFAVLAAAPVLSVIASRFEAPFWMMALPPSIAVALPLLETPLRAFLRRDPQLTMVGKTLLVSAIALGLHDLDFAFLRNRPEAAILGISIAVLVLFAISISAPATVLERATEERTRLEAQHNFQRRFFANVTHELRSPLTMILAPVESILSGAFGPVGPTQRSYLETTWRNGVRLLKLINDLLDLAKLEEGFLRLRPHKVDLHGVLEEVVADARPLAQRKGLELRLTVNGLPSKLYADVDKLEQVLVNLISNALKFTETGWVEVSAACTDGKVEIAVADSGIGIEPAQLERIFQRFNQGDGSTTRRYGGTGIGLAYAREIVELHGGTITVESTPGKGSRFVVHLKEGEGHLPKAAVEGGPSGTLEGIGSDSRDWAKRLQKQSEYRFAELSAPSASELANRPKALAPAHAQPATRLLLVDDNIEILELVRLHLAESYHVVTATDGEQGLEVAQRERPDVIVTDFMMPKMDGLAMLKRLRGDPQLADVPIVMLTAKDHLEDRLSGREAGADVYLTKPFSPRELEASIRQLLEKRGRHVQDLMRAHVEGLEIVSAGLAHELQNPLNFIKNAQLLIAENVEKLRQALAGVPDVEPARAVVFDKAQQKIGRMVESAGRGVQRIEAVVALMRRYAREGYPTEVSDVDLDRAVADVVELTAPRGEVDSQVSLDLASSGYVARIVAEDLNQVVQSLVMNAVESCGAGGKIVARTRVEGESLLLEVIDNGPGIPAAAIPKIFSSFYTTKAGTGRGLGLAIVHSVLTRAAGSVEVTSVPDVETVFRVRLPAFPASPVVDLAPVASAAGAPQAVDLPS